MEEETASYGDIIVKINECKVCPDYTIQKLHITNVSQNYQYWVTYILSIGCNPMHANLVSPRRHHETCIGLCCKF